MSKLEKYFSEKLMNKLYSLTKDSTQSNLDKADILSVWLAPYGFKEAGCGTNRIAYKRDGYIFKIALDSKGIRDNNNEYSVANDLAPYVTKCYDNNGLISVAEKVIVMDINDFTHYEKEIIKILKTISKTYILNDIGPKSFLNWGINHQGDPVILDYGYVRPITSDMQFICRKKNCDGKLRYNDDYSTFICDVCGQEYAIVDVAGDGRYRDNYNTTGIETVMNTDGIDNYNNDLTEEEQITNKNEKGDDSMASIGETLRNKVREGNANMTEVCKENPNINSAIMKTPRIISKESTKKLKKLAEY